MKAGVDYIGVGIGCLILNEKGQILLMQRGPKSKNEIGFRCQPGGKVEFGETLEDAVVREAKEETDLDVEVVMLTSLANHIIPEENQHWVSASYLARVLGGTPKLMEEGKMSQLKWFDLDDLPSPISLPTMNNISAYKKLKADNPQLSIEKKVK